MPHEWDNMVLASWRGHSFNSLNMTDNLDRRWIEHQVPYVDGVEIEDMGRAARDTSITAVYIGDKYVTELGKLRALVADGKSGTFQHPFLGTYTARLRIVSISHEDRQRNMARVELAIKEDGGAQDVEKIYSTSYYTLELTDVVDEVEDAFDAVEDLLDDIEDAVDDVQDAIDSCRSFVNNATSRITQVVRRMNTVSRKVDKAVKSAQKLGDVDSYPLVQSLRSARRSVQRLGRRVLGNKWPIRANTIAAEVPGVQVMQELFGDATRADELAEMNPGVIRNPSRIPKGVILKVFNS